MKTCRCEALPKCKNCGCDFSDRSSISSPAPDEFTVDQNFNNDNTDNGDNVNIFNGGGRWLIPFYLSLKII